MATTEEKIQMLPKRIRRSVFLLVAMALVLWACSPWVILVTFTSVGVICIYEILTTPLSRQPTISWGPQGFWRARLLMAMIVIIGVVSASCLFWLGGEYRDSFYLGLAGAITADIFALVGGLLGAKLVKDDRLKRVLLDRPVRRISEGKTTLGFAVGLFASGLAVVTTNYVINGSLPSLWMAIVIPVAAVGGDLVASAVKRVIGAGDFTIGDRPPLLGGGHGGVMDRFDAIFATWAVLGSFSAAYAAVVWLATLVGELLR